jgi:phenylacetate-CoA ligase
MSLINDVTENIILPVSDLFMGRQLTKHLRFLTKSQWWTKDQLREHQNQELQRLIRHAYDNTPYYRDLMKSLKLTPDDIRTADDLPKMPILTKQVIRENYPTRIVAKNIPTSQQVRNFSSGSTGEPFEYLFSKASQCSLNAQGIRGWNWMGYRLGDPYMKISLNAKRPRIKQIQDFVNRSRYFFFPLISDETCLATSLAIRQFKPKIVRFYFEPLFYLAKYERDHGIQPYRPQAIATTGSTMTPEARRMIEAHFGCKIFDSYSCEGTAMLNECSTHECYHATDELTVIEVLDGDNEVGHGGRGRCIATDLRNYAMPLIRYDTQDVVVRAANECSCGRNLSPFKKIEGRDCDILVAPNGRLMIVETFVAYFEYFDCIEQFQVYQDAPNHALFRLRVNNGYTPDIERRIRDYWTEAFGPGMRLDFVQVDEIKATSGKRRFLVRDASIPLQGYSGF